MAVNNLNRTRTSPAILRMKKAKKVTNDSDDEATPYGIIMDAIITQKLSPSQKVSENILVDQFGLSRTSARNIIEQLIAQKFLVTISPRITRVAPLTLLDVKQNFAMRKILQPSIFSIAVPAINHEKLARLNDDVCRNEAIKDDKAALQVLKANKAFNMYVAECAGYPLLIHWVSQLEDTTMRIYWLYVQIAGSLPFAWEHQLDLVETIRSENPEQIEKRVISILSASEESILKAVFSHNKLVSQDLCIPSAI